MSIPYLNNIDVLFLYNGSNPLELNVVNDIMIYY